MSKEQSPSGGYKLYLSNYPSIYISFYLSIRLSLFIYHPEGGSKLQPTKLSGPIKIYWKQLKVIRSSPNPPFSPWSTADGLNQIRVALVLTFLPFPQIRILFGRKILYHCLLTGIICIFWPISIKKKAFCSKLDPPIL